VQHAGKSRNPVASLPQKISGWRHNEVTLLEEGEFKNF
jgi:hypothetical protein